MKAAPSKIIVVKYKMYKANDVICSGSKIEKINPTLSMRPIHNTMHNTSNDCNSRWCGVSLWRSELQIAFNIAGVPSTRAFTRYL